MIKDDHRASDNIPLQNAKFIILIFDDIVTDYGYLSTRSLSEFYLKLLNIVKINPDFGCIIKSKQSHLEGLYLLPSEREIRALIDELTQERRLVFLEIDVLPSTVARFAHLSVNYSINSAGVIAAISNETPSIHWDCAGLSKHPFWKDSQQKLIFNTLDDIEDAILKANRQDKSIGDFSAWKKYISYFNDQLGAQRMGGFVNTYMRESIKTKDPQWSLDFAVKKYMQENKVGNDFLVMESRWGDEE
jgi:hypothetical protein